MLTPYCPDGLIILTDHRGNRVAVVAPVSRQVVRTFGVPAPLVVRGASGLLVTGGLTASADIPGLRTGRFDTFEDLLNRFSGVFPDQGPYTGGTVVTLIGHHFTGATDVRFGLRSAASFAVLDDATIMAVTPAGTGAVPVTVTTPGGSARIGYFFYIRWPSLRGIVPAAGPIGGGNIVDLSGVNLFTALLVNFGAATAHPTAVSDQQLLVAAPPAAGPGTVPVYVTTIGGVSNRLLYTYVAAPAITGVSPETGPVAGGTTVLVTGTALSLTTAVTVGGVPAASFRAFSDTLLVVVTPPGAAGPADLTITTPGGTVTVPGAFDYQAPSATAVTSAPDPSVVGQPVTFTATVTGVPPETGTPTGTVTFDFGDGTPAVVAQLEDGTATVTHAYADPSATSYTVTATYSGDTLFVPSSGTDTQTVGAAATATTVTSAPDPSQPGQPVTVFAHVALVAPGAGAPTGTVTFDFGDGTPQTVLPLSGGAATVDHAYADVGGSPYTITATYSGDADFTGSSGTDTQTVEQATTTTGLDLAPNPSVTGQQVTATATVTAVPPGAGTPTGTVTFDFGDGSPATTVPLTGGAAGATHTYTGTAGSPYQVTATYNGDTNFTPSTATGGQAVGQAQSTTAVVSAPDPSAVGEEGTFTATVTAVAPGAGTPTGTVTFDFGDGSPTATVPLTGGAADTTHAYADTATYPVAATYNGDTDFTGSSGTDTHTVQPADTTTGVTSAPDPSTVGEEGTFTATVTAVAPGAGTPTGTVTFDFGDTTPPVTAPLTGSTATTTHTYADADDYSVTATYNGDTDFTGSSGTDTHTVQPADTATAVTAAPDPSGVGQSTTFVAQVVPEAPASGAPTGTVTFEFSDGSPDVTAPVVGGTAMVGHTSPDVAESPLTVTAAYSGDDNFNPSVGTGAHDIVQGVSTTEVTASPSPSVTGQTVTFTAAVSAVPPASGTPTGTVTFDFGDGTTPVTVDALSGLATVTHAYTTAGGSPYTITATYDGAADFSASDATDTHTVLQGATTMKVTGAPDPSVAGEPVTVTATATAIPPGAGVPTGTVTVDFGDGTAPSTVPLAGGAVVLTHTYTSSVGSPFAIVATYSGSADFTASADTESQTVVPAGTTLTVVSTPDPSVSGQPVTFTATVAPVAPGGGTPTGTVTFDFGDGSNPASVPVVDGTATAQYAYPGTSGSPYTVTATYGGDVNFTGSGATTTQTVAQAAATVTVVTSPDPSLVGQLATVTATVAAQAPGSGTPTGTVTFNFDDGTAPVTVPVTAGVATATHIWGDTSGTPFAITADYSGDADFTASTGTDTHIVGPAATAITVVSSPDPSVVGQPVAVTATVAAVAPGAGSPPGTVTVDFGDGTPAVTVSLTDGSATVTHVWDHTSGSPYTVTATYDGHPDFTGSTGTDAQTVGPAATTTTLSGLPQPSVTGQPVTFIAQVVPDAPGEGSPMGAVTFDFGDGTPTVLVPVNDGVATTTHAYADAAGSPYTVSATYGGDGDFTGSVGTETHTVQPAPTTTVVGSSPDPSVSGQPVTVTATVAAQAPGSGTPTGSVTFTFGDGSPSVTAPLAAGTATATHTWADTSGSAYTITADYGGDAGFTASTGTDTQSVTPAATTTTVESSPDPSVVGQPVAVTATVAPAAPGAGTPTGRVTFTFGDGSPSVTAPLAAGTATATHTWTGTSGSPHTVTADYGGDANFSSSTGTDPQTVVPAAAELTLGSSPDPSVTGEAVTFTARVSVAAPGAGQPTGTVTFDFGDGSPTVTAPVADGVATITHAYADASGSPYTVTATYSGDADFAPATVTDTHAVSPSATTTSTSVVSSPDPSVTGQPVTFTATVAPAPPGAGVPTGTITFTFGDGTAAITAPLSGGVATATHAYASATGSPYTVTAEYGGDANFSSSTGTDTQTVEQASTATTVASAPDPSVTGQPVAFTATVSPVAPGAGVPTGTVTFDFGDGAPTASVPVIGGVARITHTYNSAGGPYTVTANYGGDASFTASGGTDTQTVGKAATTTSVTSSPDPTVVGQPTTITATVASIATGAGSPTGTVTLTFGDGTPSATAPVSNGLATFTHTYTGASGSPYTITGSYNGDGDFTASSGTDTQTVNKAATTTSVTSSPDPTVVGQPTTITATVASIAPGAGSPTGTVTLTFGDGTGSATVPLSGGIATVTHAYAATSGTPYPITATYNGDDNFTSSSGTDTQTVSKAATATAVTSSPDPSVAGQPVTVTATVAPIAPGAGSPTGTVTFTFGDGTSPASGTLSGGIATVAHVFSGTSGSPFAITATYNGDTNFTASSGTDTQTVNKAATSTSVVSSPDPSTVGQSVTLTATVSPVAPGSGIPTGTVTFTFGDATSPATATLTNGIATVTHSYATRNGSPYTVTATYNGDTNFTTSSGTDTQTVNKAATSTSVVSSPDPSTVGQSVTLTATVAAIAPGAGTPTGTVTFTFGDGTSPATGTLSGGVATVTHPYTTRNGSPFTITATYNGDTNFTASSGTDTQTLTKITTTTTVTSTPDPSVVGQSVTIKATVASASGTPTGMVTFAFGDGTSSVAAPLSGGIATVTHTYTTTTGSPFTITATYGGNDSYASSSGTDTQTVSRAATTTSVVATPNPALVSDPVTVTATVAPVAPGTGTPTGTVTLAIPGRTPQTVPLVGGTASALFNPLPKGTYTVTANYNGSVNHAPSAGTTTLVVTTPGGGS